MLFRTSRIAVIAGLSLLTSTSVTRGASVPEAEIVYEKTFERRPGAEWSKTEVDVTPQGHRAFLGMFGGEGVSLSLKDLPKHRFIRVTFSLLVINTMDGSHKEYGPDVWDVSLEGGPSLLHTTFNNCGAPDNNEQAFPDEFPQPPGRPWPAFTGADEKQTFGYANSWAGPDRTLDTSSVYNLSFTLPHAAEAATFRFTSYSTEDKRNESWGIERIRVETVADATPPGEPAMEQSWRDLAGADPMRAFRAKWALVAAGEPAKTFLERKLKADAVDAIEVAALVAKLSDDRFETREAATMALIGLGLPAVPVLNKALDEEESPEAIGRIKQAVASIRQQADRDPDALRRTRAAHALRLIAGEPCKFTPQQNGVKSPTPATTE